MKKVWRPFGSALTRTHGTFTDAPMLPPMRVAGDDRAVAIGVHTLVLE
jgi:hypothetical protein